MLVSGNFFNLLAHYYALEPKVDLIITEMHNTRYRQPAWYRYAAGFAQANRSSSWRTRTAGSSPRWWRS